MKFFQLFSFSILFNFKLFEVTTSKYNNMEEWIKCNESTEIVALEMEFIKRVRNSREHLLSRI